MYHLDKINFDDVHLVLSSRYALGVAGKVAEGYCKDSTVIYSNLYLYTHILNLALSKWSFKTNLSFSNLIFSK
jgi:hypothetical protein